MPSNHLILCCPFSFVPQFFPASGSFSNELALHIRWPSCWSVRFNISSSNQYSRLISFRIDWFSPCCSRDSQVSSPAPKFESISSLAFNLLYVPTLISIHNYWKNYNFDNMKLCQQNDVSVFKYTFLVSHSSLPRSKNLLISCLQSQSAVILESNKLKSLTVFTFSPCICHEVMEQYITT